MNKDGETHSHPLQSSQRDLGFFSVIAMVISLQLGSAMFLLPNQIAPYGVYGIASWVLTGIGALSLCHVFSSLSLTSAEVGGPHIYVSKAFGDSLGFLTGWSYWIISWLSSLPVLSLAVSSLEHIFGVFPSSIYLLIEFSLLLLLLLLNLRGAALSGAGEIVFTLLKVIPMIAIPLASFFLGKWNWAYFKTVVTLPVSPFQSLNQASLLTFWGFIGLEASTTLTNCVKNAGYIVPKALFFGTLTVILIYILNTICVVSCVPYDILLSSKNPYSLLMESMGGAWYGQSISWIVFIMCMGTLNSWLLTSGQIAMMASKEHLFPRWFGKYNRHESPWFSLVLTTSFLFLGVFLLQKKDFSHQVHLLIQFSTILFILIYILAVMACIKFLKKGVLKGGFALYISIVTATLFCIWSILTTPLTTILGSLAVPALGFLLKKLWNFQKRIP